MLTQERLKELLHYDPDTGIFTNLTKRGGCAKKGAVAGCNDDGYVRIEILGKKYRAHRLVWLYVYGEFPEKSLDHINEIRNDNRIINLRLATHQENLQNVSRPKSGSTSGFIGINWNNYHQKWQARIAINGKNKHLGYFNTAEQGFEAYLAAKREHHTFWKEKVT